MDGKGTKCGSKRGSKIVQFDADADDDEPIGSLLKVMKHKSAKKNKVETESVGKQRKKQAAEKKLSDSEDMDDTLASFRKRLKGHKKSVGSGIPMIRNYKDVPPIDNVTSSNLNLSEEGHDMVDDASELGMDGGTVKERFLDDVDTPKVKSRTRSTIDSNEAGAESFCSKTLAVKKMVDSTLECYTHKPLLDCSTKNKRVNCISENGASNSFEKCTSETETLLHKFSGEDEAASPAHENVEMPMTLSSEKEADVFHQFPDDEPQRPLPNVHGSVYPPVARKEVAVTSPDQPLHLGEPESESGYIREKKLVMCDCGILVNFEDRSFESNTQVAICPKCKYSSNHTSSNRGGNQVDTLKDGTADSPISVPPCEDENLRGDAISLPDSGKPSTLQRPERIAKKRKLGNMVYEGDMKWENEQGFLDCQSDKSFKGSDKCDFVPFISKETELGRAAAVAAGLKAQSVSPIEKIILKEVLKRKGSHQEYLVCRLVSFSIAVMDSNTWFCCFDLV